ncbi:hypothetical protein [Sutterella wadsworthensis]|uniref:hypothetical protein n=1 Tax=Sutterella wadsworthensis TaxID=40545 RepID=UPI001F0E7CD1|nr:hypothetical protein [Sutterella wadsworthensis]
MPLAQWSSEFCSAAKQSKAIDRLSQEKSGFGATERITSVPDQKEAAALDVQCRCGGGCGPLYEQAVFAGISRSHCAWMMRMACRRSDKVTNRLPNNSLTKAFMQLLIN